MIEQMKPEQTLIFTVEDVDGEESDYKFYCTTFSNREIILYDGPNAEIGIIQDYCGMLDYDDLMEAVWYGLTNDEEYKVLIKN